ncbi:MAG: DNA cytosine methyltransferase [Hamadaea sp.]|uniref:DNA cytosine methyltransferase n=1 Tax=Hamadaea sp. TaxID=2024425 RepID=UPI00180E3C51|nr:DNA cytosine methyltransferase [Hamadaea sp.]NUT23813.1 DNA cytosine methyltransferase [Hamadaea sp.]
MTARPRLLDLFCCAGGASMGYHLAGFDVVGVDNRPQPNYPFTFHQGDALEFLAAHGDRFDAIHASPPCHDHTPLANVVGHDGTGWLLDATRTALDILGRPYVIENVPGADMPGAVTLCGTEFGLHTDTATRGRVWLRRHRRFESNRLLMGAGGCYCHTKRGRIIGVYGTGDSGQGHGWKGSFTDRQTVMGIDWMTREELSQAIPPAMTRFIGEQLLAALIPTGGAR